MYKTKYLSINIYSLLLYSMALYAAATLIYSLIPNIPLNKLFTMCISITILYLYIQKLTLERVMILLLCLFFSIYTLLISENYYTNIEHLLWMISTVLIIGIAKDKEFQSGLGRAIRKNKQNIIRIIVFIEIVLLISVLNPSSYGNRWGWGEDVSYFVGFATNGHTLASTCCLLMVLIMLVFNEQKIKLTEYLYFILPLYSILFSGARTYLISVLILLIINIYTKKNTRFSRNITFAAILVSFIFAFFKSSMMSKFEFSSNNVYAKNILDSITNGRSEFWRFDIELFFSSNFFIQLFGRGFDYIYSFHLQKIGISIWAHNDIINSLISVGIIGTLGYLYIWIKYLINFSRKINFEFSNLKFTIIILFTLYIVVPMLLNGLYPYQHYMFSCVILGQIVSQRRNEVEEFS